MRKDITYSTKRGCLGHDQDTVPTFDLDFGEPMCQLAGTVVEVEVRDYLVTANRHCDPQLSRHLCELGHVIQPNCGRVQAPSWPQHSTNLGECPCQVRNVIQHVVGDDSVEAVLLIGDRLGIDFPECEVQARAESESARPPAPSPGKRRKG